MMLWVCLIVVWLLALDVGEAHAQTYFAEVDANGVVQRVIVADQEFINSGKVGDPSNWVQTFVNGQRTRYGNPGFVYNRAKDKFEPPRPFPSWRLNETTGEWEAPANRPAGDDWQWNEARKRWERQRP